jgi:hypothetical protein
MLVRDSCGGRDKITPAFSSQFEYINLELDVNNGALDSSLAEGNGVSSALDGAAAISDLPTARVA